MVSEASVTSRFFKSNVNIRDLTENQLSGHVISFLLATSLLKMFICLSRSICILANQHFIVYFPIAVTESRFEKQAFPKEAPLHGHAKVRGGLYRLFGCRSHLCLCYCHRETDKREMTRLQLAVT